ncbi:MAG: YajQ family cyclic di-GMP-binding protein [Bdellovibrionota bacterium]
MPTFDVVSKVDMQEVDNAVNQARKEIGTRYDFRGTKCSIELENNGITLLADDKMKLQAMTEILNQKMVKRGVGVRSLDFKEPETASGDSLRQQIEIKQGISTDDARKIVKLVKELNLKKVSAQIQGDQVRVNGPKRDDLQAVIAMLKQSANLELQFVNFKD